VADSAAIEASSGQASFAEHVRAFHQSLPREEQELLERIFALAQKAEGDVQGFGAIDLNSFSWGIGRGISSPTGGSADRESSAPSVSEIVVTKGP
jgi:hypothetical protein